MNNLPDFTMRRATPDDSDFAFMVKKITFQKYVEMVWDWDESVQRILHEKIFAEQEFWILSKAGIDIGILAQVRGTDRIDVKQLFLLTDYHRQGIGFACMKEILNEAKRESIPVHIQTLKVNFPAQAFAEKLGFNRDGETETHIQWMWNE